MLSRLLSWPFRASNNMSFRAGIFLGAATYPYSPALSNSRFRTSKDDLESYIIDPEGLGVEEDHILDLFDSRLSVSQQLVRIAESLKLWTSSNVNGDLIVYYVGHGCFVDNTYVLSVGSTRAGHEEATSLNPRSLANTLRQFRTRFRKFLIFDCCYAAELLRSFQSGNAIDRKIVSAFDEQLPASFSENPPFGTALLCASDSETPARSPNDLSRTMFSNALLETLRIGDPSLDSDFSLFELIARVWQRLHEAHGSAAVRPTLHTPDQSNGDISRWVELFPNPPYTEKRKLQRTSSLRRPRRIRRDLPHASVRTERHPDATSDARRLPGGTAEETLRDGGEGDRQTKDLLGSASTREGEALNRLRALLDEKTRKLDELRLSSDSTVLELESKIKSLEALLSARSSELSELALKSAEMSKETARLRQEVQNAAGAAERIESLGKNLRNAQQECEFYKKKNDLLTITSAASSKEAELLRQQREESAPKISKLEGLVKELREENARLPQECERRLAEREQRSVKEISRLTAQLAAAQTKALQSARPASRQEYVALAIVVGIAAILAILILPTGSSPVAQPERSVTAPNDAKSLDVKTQGSGHANSESSTAGPIVELRPTTASAPPVRQTPSVRSKRPSGSEAVTIRLVDGKCPEGFRQLQDECLPESVFKRR
jgi:hypothetical protein